MHKIPDRWTNYSKVGTKVAGTRFLPFKVPLSWKPGPEEEWFTPAILLETVPSLSAVIDLTNTDRYYNKTEFLSKGIFYKKIYCEGRQIPSSQVIDQFYWAVEKALKLRNHKEVLIGVHCTHGLNRTGYLICRYMVERMGMDPKIAIEAFEDARGHKMERQNYLTSIQNLSCTDESNPNKSKANPNESEAYPRPSNGSRFRSQLQNRFQNEPPTHFKNERYVDDWRRSNSTHTRNQHQPVFSQSGSNKYGGRGYGGRNSGPVDDGYGQIGYGSNNSWRVREASAFAKQKNSQSNHEDGHSWRNKTNHTIASQFPSTSRSLRPPATSATMTRKELQQDRTVINPSDVNNIRGNKYHAHDPKRKH